jgi:hypothetical protein
VYTGLHPATIRGDRIYGIVFDSNEVQSVVRGRIRRNP